MTGYYESNEYRADFTEWLWNHATSVDRLTAMAAAVVLGHPDQRTVGDWLEYWGNDVEPHEFDRLTTVLTGVGVLHAAYVNSPFGWDAYTRWHTDSDREARTEAADVRRREIEEARWPT